MTTPTSWAYAFDCDAASTTEIQAILNAAGPWSWGMGDSVWYGSPLRCTPAEGVKARIVDSGELTEGTAAGLMYQAEQIREAEREGRPPPTFKREGRCQISVELAATATVRREEIDGVVRGLLERLGARNITDSTEW
jgi:hypothetical protein